MKTEEREKEARSLPKDLVNCLDYSFLSNAWFPERVQSVERAEHFLTGGNPEFRKGRRETEEHSLPKDLVNCLDYSFLSNAWFPERVQSVERAERFLAGNS